MLLGSIYHREVHQDYHHCWVCLPLWFLLNLPYFYLPITLRPCSLFVYQFITFISLYVTFFVHQNQNRLHYFTFISFSFSWNLLMKEESFCIRFSLFTYAFHLSSKCFWSSSVLEDKVLMLHMDLCSPKMYLNHVLSYLQAPLSIQEANSPDITGCELYQLSLVLQSCLRL